MSLKKYTLIFLSLISLVLMIDTVHAYYKEEVYNNALYNQQTAKTTFGKNITLNLDTTEQNIVVRIQNGPMISVNNNSCESKDYWIVCFEGLEFGFFNTNESSEKYSYGPVNKAKTRVYIEPASVILTKTIDDADSSIKPGEKAKITFRFKNIGTRPAENFSLTDIYKDAIDLEEVSGEGCKISGKKNMTWFGTILPDQEKTCEATIRGVKTENAKDRALLIYWNGEYIKEYQEPSEFTIFVRNATFVLNATLSKKTINVGDEFFYNISLTNYGKESDIITNPLEIKLDEGFIILDKSNDLKYKNEGVFVNKSQLTWSGSVDNTRPTNLFIRLKATKSGKHNFQVYAKAQDSGSELIFNKNTFVDSQNSIPYVLIFKRGNQIDISLENPGWMAFKDIEVNITTTNSESKKQYSASSPKLDPGGNLIAKSINITDLNSERSDGSTQAEIEIETTAVFKSEFEEEFKADKKAYFNLKTGKLENVALSANTGITISDTSRTIESNTATANLTNTQPEQGALNTSPDKTKINKNSDDKKINKAFKMPNIPMTSIINIAILLAILSAIIALYANMRKNR
ncbi:MAG: hypothetical protein Q8O89_06485 [Nanoarchaeota archaeon]|nr:hypothetical protein [Nanoarchaeota archaeon]